VSDRRPKYPDAARDRRDAAFAAIVDAKAEAVFVAPNGYFASRSSQLATLAARDRMPTSHFVTTQSRPAC
jgi:hypothetical protein